MNAVGKYEVKTFPSSRLSTVDVCHIGSKKHYIEALIELDVTQAREKLREKKRLGEEVSFTAWLIKCISSLCVEFKQLHGVRSGRRKVIVFDDVDISILVEREVQGERVPLPYVIRQTNEKSISEIYHEIISAQNQPIHNEGDYVLGGKWNAGLMKMYYTFPGFVRRFFLNRMIRNPLSAKKEMGTVVITSLGMMGRINGWIMPVGIHPLIVAVGSINKKPGVVHKNIEIREFLTITLMVDHDVIDGAPAVRALSRLTKMMESGFGL